MKVGASSVRMRKPEAAPLHIPMGEPYFKIKRLAEHGRVVIFSSNYRLYGDMSNRVMKTLQQWTPNVEIYSIDEAFLDFTGLGIERNGIDSFLQEITTTVRKWTGIPVSLGLGTTMTLAKVANDVAKKGNGTCSLLRFDEIILLPLPNDTNRFFCDPIVNTGVVHEIDSLYNRVTGNGSNQACFDDLNGQQ